MHDERGFTLIELLVVIAIMGILASIIFNSIRKAREFALIGKAKAELEQIRRTVFMLEVDANEWPGHKAVGTIEGGAGNNEIWDLTVPEAGLVATDGNFDGWKGPYITAPMKDPWGNHYFFDTDYDIDSSGAQKWAAVVGSFGPNGEGQNVYDSDDIIEILAE